KPIVFPIPYLLSLPLVIVLGYLTINAFLEVAKRMRFGPLCIMFGLLLVSLSLFLIFNIL
ncbi:MAG: hypothetical protein ACTSWV_03455, partial [Candidatus Asgardarchaeia archaeon]